MVVLSDLNSSNSAHVEFDSDCLSLMTISPSLNSQFNVWLTAVVTNIIPYILSMAALVIIQKMANVPSSKRKSLTSWLRWRHV